MMVDYISEIFPTVQGEGPFTGERQIFVRFAGCPLRCDYCDTPASLTTMGHKRMDVKQVLNRVIELRKLENISTVSVTGGEPLVHVPFLEKLFPLLKENNFKIYLETAGVHPEGLKKIVMFCDVISMDIKLPSATGKEYWEEHEDFLKVAEGKVFVKMVIENHSTESEIEKAIALVKNDPSTPQFIIQPVTQQSESITPPSDERIQAILELAKKELKQVSVMRQQHKIWGIR